MVVLAHLQVGDITREALAILLPLLLAELDVFAQESLLVYRGRGGGDARGERGSHTLTGGCHRIFVADQLALAPLIRRTLEAGLQAVDLGEGVGFAVYAIRGAWRRIVRRQQNIAVR